MLVSETSLVQDQGFRSVPAFVASASGETEHRARQALALAKGVSQLPSLDSATRQGTVSQRQALAIVRGANGDDPRARQLIDVANDNCLKELEARARQGSGFRSAEEEQNHFNKLYEARSCYWFKDFDGAEVLTARLMAEDAARLKSLIARGREVVFQEKRAAGTKDSFNQNTADALVRLFQRPASGVSNAGRRVVDALLVVDVASLRRGHREAGEVCEIKGAGSVSVAKAKELLGESLFSVLVKDGQNLLSATSKTRTWKSVTKRAVEFRDSRCCVDKCSDEAFLQIDHINPWANSGETTLANARRLCVFHHLLLSCCLGLGFGPGLGSVGAPVACKFADGLNHEINERNAVEHVVIKRFVGFSDRVHKCGISVAV